MKVVLDTNVLVSALIVRVGKPAQILRQIGKFELLISEEILAETERVLHYDHIQKRYHPSEEDIATYLEELRKTSILVSVKSNDQVIKADPDDDMFLVCATAAKASPIVSGDHHLLNMGNFGDIQILKVVDALKER